MVDHIYGRSESLVAAERPHMFAKELEMYVDYFQDEVDAMTADKIKELTSFHKNLLSGMEYIKEIAAKTPYKDENLASIPGSVEENSAKLQKVFEQFEAKAASLQEA